MINLLPENIRKELIGDYRRRRVATAAFLFLALILIGIVLLISFYLTLALQEKTLDSLLLVSEAQTAKDDFEHIQQVARDTNRQAQLIIKDDQSAFRPSLVLAEIFDLVPAGIEIHDLSFQLNTDDELAVAVSGLANRREALVAYLEQIKDNPNFTEFNAPITNLIQGTDTDFSLSFIFDYDR